MAKRHRRKSSATRKTSRRKGPGPPVQKLTYAEALRAADRARIAITYLPDLSSEPPPYPDLPVHPMTQVKLILAIHLMAVIGRSPGDFPIDEFDEPITYRRLEKQSLDWLEECGIPARRRFAPFGTEAYIELFGNRSRFPIPEGDLERFFGRWTHCLLTEVQILLTRQYYYGLGLHKVGSNLARLDETLRLSETVRATRLEPEIELDALNAVAFDELHGKIFLEYYAIMIRAQWDKLVRLTCLVFGMRWNWGSISEGLEELEQKVASGSDLGLRCHHHLRILVEIAQDRLAEQGWLKRFRDPLLHDVGQHSAGVLPHRKSIETTSEMWDKARDEHDWVREAMMTALIAFASIKS